MSAILLKPKTLRGNINTLGQLGSTVLKRTTTSSAITITSASAVLSSSCYTTAIEAGSSGISVYTPTTAALSTGATSSAHGGKSSSSNGNQTTVIVLGTVLSVVGAVLISGAILACVQCRRSRTRLFKRSISPIDDDEIASWKGNGQEMGVSDGVTTEDSGHQRHESIRSARKSTSVIVYSIPRKSDERCPKAPQIQTEYGKRSLDGRKPSFDKELPQTPIQARAPNAREGLTDEAIPGDEPFVQGSKRQTSRLHYKMTPPQNPRQTHNRNKSLQSNFRLRSLGEHNRPYDSDIDLIWRSSQDNNQAGPSKSQRHSCASSPAANALRLSTSGGWLKTSSTSPASRVRSDESGQAIG